MKIPKNPHIATQFLLLGLISLLVYHPTLFSEYSLVDDETALNSLKSLHQISLKDIFFPGSHRGGYYRPLVILSQHLDSVLWNLDTRITHLENIVLHLINSLWLFFIVRLYLGQIRQRFPLVPLGAALLFALHPLASESINWYSGRTDLLAGFFVFPALYCLVQWSFNLRLQWALGALALMMTGMLAKESSLGLLLIAPMIVMSTRPKQIEAFSDSIRKKLLLAFLVCFSVSFVVGLLYYVFWPTLVLAVVYAVLHLFVVAHGDAAQQLGRMKRFGIHLLLVVVAVVFVLVLFYVVRHMAFKSQQSTIWLTVVHIFQDPDYAIGQFLGAFAFYFKKFFIPVPLNFAIREIDPLYQLAGIGVVFACVSLLLNRTRETCLVLSGFILLLPALPFVFGTIAWTSYAERYVYLSSAMWIISLSLLYLKYSSVLPVARIVVPALILAAAVISHDRSRTWQTNVSLFADTARKSPRFREIHAFYMVALYEQGSLEEAAKEYHIASLLPYVTYNPGYDVMYAKILHGQGKREESRALLNQVIQRTKGSSKTALQVKSELFGKE